MDNIRIIKTGINVSKIVRQLEKYSEDWGGQKKMEGVEQCHSGDINGPTFKRDKNGKTNNIDYYYFKNKCIGTGCKA